MNLLKLFRYLKKRDLVYALISLVFIVTQVWLDLRMPDFMSEITKLVQTEGSAMSEILKAGGLMLLCALGSVAASILTGFFVARIAAGLAMRLREAVYNRVMAFTMEEIGGFSTASLITRSTNDITQIQMVVAIGLQAMVKAPIMAVWAILKIAGKSWQWTTVTAVAVGVLMVLIVVLFVLVVPRFTKIQKLTDHLNLVTRENLNGIRVVRAYNAEQYQEAKFEKANVDLMKTHLFTGRVLAVMSPMMTLIMSGLTLAIYWVGVYMIDAAQGMEKINLFSDMVVFSSYAMQVIMAFMMLTMTMIVLPRAAVSAGRINEVLRTKPRIQDGTVTEPDASRAGEIEFRDVSFRYPDAADDILKHITFSAKRGETVAFIGATGSGKSTLVNLIPRFYDVTGGELIVDGVNVKDYSKKALRDRIGYVPQRAVLFSGTVRSNVAYGDNGKASADDALIKQAVAIAQAEEFVSKLEGTYDAPIAQGGTNVSGGQKQRLSIARAIARQPEIYIFDDSFSALDYKTDRTLRHALKEQTGGATTLIVAQRIGTILDADRIIVLEDGEIAGIGTHKELLNTCPIYREIAESQLTKEEIEHA